MSASTWHRFEVADLPDEGRVRAAVLDGLASRSEPFDLIPGG